MVSRVLRFSGLCTWPLLMCSVVSGQTFIATVGTADASHPITVQYVTSGNCPTPNTFSDNSGTYTTLTSDLNFFFGSGAAHLLPVVHAGQWMPTSGSFPQSYPAWASPQEEETLSSAGVLALTFRGTFQGSGVFEILSWSETIDLNTSRFQATELLTQTFTPPEPCAYFRDPVTGVVTYQTQTASIYQAILTGSLPVTLTPTQAMTFLSAVSGNNQNGNVQQALCSPLVVKIADESGNPVSGVQVIFQITQQPSGASGAAVTMYSATTGADGTASTGLTMGTSTGQYLVTATCSSCNPVSVTFLETALARPGTITLLDPVASPGFLAKPTASGGSPIIGSSTTLASLAPSARVVDGVASDGVTQVVVSIGGACPNEELKLSLDADGTLANIGSTAFQPLNLTLQADLQGNAFALYRAPVDFARSSSDYDLVFRNVYMHLQSRNDPNFTADSQIKIVRPLVFMIHGLWSNNKETWGTFSPLVAFPGPSDPRFVVEYGNFDDVSQNVSVLSSNPSQYDVASTPIVPFVLNLLPNVKGGSLGNAITTPWVLGKLQKALAVYENGTNEDGANPALVPIAGIQADIVAHSMGGMIARNLALQPGFSSPPTLGAGLIHKLITVDTPHLGTPIAQQFLAPTKATCVRNLLALLGNFAFNTVTTSSGTITGAVGDLEGAGDLAHPTQLSSMLQSLTKSGVPIPTATIAGIMNDGNLLGLVAPSTAAAITALCPADTLAVGLTPTTWNSFFVADSAPSLYPAAPQVEATMGWLARTAS